VCACVRAGVRVRMRVRAVFLNIMFVNVCYPPSSMAGGRNFERLNLGVALCQSVIIYK
jgi:hypothetical protein